MKVKTIQIRAWRTIQVTDYHLINVSLEVGGELDPDEDYIRTFRKLYWTLHEE